MDLQVVTEHLRSSAHSYAGVADECLSAAKGVASAGHDAGTAIQDGAVSGALARVVVSLMGNLQTFGGATTYAGSELNGSAEEYDAVDASSHAGLIGLMRRG